MVSEDFLIRLSVVFKKFGLILNEFLPIVDCLFHICIINLSLEFYISHFGNKAINDCKRFRDASRYTSNRVGGKH